MKAPKAMITLTDIGTVIELRSVFKHTNDPVFPENVIFCISKIKFNFNDAERKIIHIRNHDDMNILICVKIVPFLCATKTSSLNKLHYIYI